MSPAAKVGAFVAGLLAVGLLGAGVGAVVGPVDTASPDHDEASAHEGPAAHDTAPGSEAGGPEHDDGAGPGDPSDEDGHGEHGGGAGPDDGSVPDADGYRLELAPLGEDLSFTVVGPDGHPVTATEERHTKPLHLIVVGRDLVTYAHLHPTVDGDGRWSTPAPDLGPGSYRVVADLVPAGGPELALVADLTVPGPVAAVAVPPAEPTAEVDGLTASLEGDPAVGDAALAFTISRDGEVLTPEPHLGARGHLVALRAADLAYSHVHPHDDGDGTPVAFTAGFPTGGTYRLFLDIRVDGEVHTFAFTVEVPDHEH